jgi:hypothetical protein
MDLGLYHHQENARIKMDRDEQVICDELKILADRQIIAITTSP